MLGEAVAEGTVGNHIDGVCIRCDHRHVFLLQPSRILGSDSGYRRERVALPVAAGQEPLLIARVYDDEITLSDGDALCCIATIEVLVGDVEATKAG